MWIFNYSNGPFEWKYRFLHFFAIPYISRGSTDHLQMGGFRCINPHEMRQVLSDCWDCCKRGIDIALVQSCAAHRARWLNRTMNSYSLAWPVGCMECRRPTISLFRCCLEGRAHCANWISMARTHTYTCERTVADSCHQVRQEFGVLRLRDSKRGYIYSEAIFTQTSPRPRSPSAESESLTR